MTGVAENNPPAGRLIVLSAPSGTGKTTLARLLIERVSGLVRSVSYTTRTRRAAETDGVDYHFVDAPKFRSMAEADAFLEWAEIYGKLYGTGREATRDALAVGNDLLLVIDVQGARWVSKREPEALRLFLLPPGFEALAERLHRRGTESTGTEAERLAVACDEIRSWTEYDYLIINDDIDAAIAAAEAIIRAARQTRGRMEAAAEAVARTFPNPPRGREIGV